MASSLHSILEDMLSRVLFASFLSVVAHVSSIWLSQIDIDT